eukprot:Gb_29980 [translate_table: standard]
MNRGMVMEDTTVPHGVRLVIEDYPYSVDGLKIWFAIVSWVKQYLSFYYKTDYAVKSNMELQAWWSKIVNVGHGDKKDKSWCWSNMESVEELEKTMTTIIWVASALHAYQYAGYMPNRPTVSRRFIPKEGSTEHFELVKNGDAVFLKIISNQFQTTLGIALIEILLRHSTDEVYLGKRTTNDWTDDKVVTRAF